MPQPHVTVIGGGLAGCEAALQLADAGLRVRLFEMRPQTMTPAHRTGGLAELVCSNSLKGNSHTSPHGLLKEELARLGSRLLPLARACAVPAGDSLAVDRTEFSRRVQEAIGVRPGIELVREEVRSLDPEKWTVVAAGPLASTAISAHLIALLGQGSLAFFDALAPVVEAGSIDLEHAFLQNRNDKGTEPDFLNCPLSKIEYQAFVAALLAADAVEERPYEPKELFEGCLPIEEMARRGPNTLRFGPLRPIGLYDPREKRRPYAVLQLRAENQSRSIYNLVGCQTRLRQGAQREVFALIPALRHAVFARYGAMHRNCFINTPALLDATLRRPDTNLFFAGQITGAEGYTEALATGLYAAASIYSAMNGMKAFSLPAQTSIGALVRQLTSPHPDFQPMNMNFGLFDEVPPGLKGRERKEWCATRCLAALEQVRLPWAQ